MGAMAHREEAAPFEILEHTADIGIRATGRTLEELFANAAWGMADILGARAKEGGSEPTTAELDVEGADREALLVAWLDEILFRVEHSGTRVADLSVRSVGERSLEGHLDLAEGQDRPDGTELKAATYHQ